MASRRATTLLCTLARRRPVPLSQPSPLLAALRQTKQPQPPPFLPRASQRCAHSIPRPPPAPATPPPSPTADTQPTVALAPHYELTFTCIPCGARSRHNVSKQGYHHGSVLITCPECRNRHVISDHLKVFSEEGTTLEQLMSERGRLVKRGALGEDGDVEFWEDGTETVREERRQEEEVREVKRAAPESAKAEAGAMESRK